MNQIMEKCDVLDQRLGNYSMRAKSGPRLVFLQPRAKNGFNMFKWLREGRGLGGGGNQKKNIP